MKTALVNIDTGNGTCRREFVALKGEARSGDCIRVRGEVFRILVTIHQTAEPAQDEEWEEFFPDRCSEFDIELVVQPESLTGMRDERQMVLSF